MASFVTWLECPALDLQMFRMGAIGPILLSDTPVRRHQPNVSTIIPTVTLQKTRSILTDSSASLQDKPPGPRVVKNETEYQAFGYTDCKCPHEAHPLASTYRILTLPHDAVRV